MQEKMQAFRCALPYTLPICAGFLVLGLAYGILMQSHGFSFLYPLCMSLVIFAGSMEFASVPLLLGTFQPFYAFFLALLVGARHLFYGVSMLERFQGTGRKKAYLIFGMCDESFSINCTVLPPPEVDRGWFMFFVTLLNHCYWVAGAALGGLLGKVIPFSTKGIDFVMTALFAVMFLNQWEESKDHRPALLGLVSSALCLLLFGSQQFILPAMALILLLFMLLRRYDAVKGVPHK